MGRVGIGWVCAVTFANPARAVYVAALELEPASDLHFAHPRPEEEYFSSNIGGDVSSISHQQRYDKRFSKKKKNRLLKQMLNPSNGIATSLL